MLKTTFGKIKSFNPCKDGWEKLMELNPENDMNKEITILEILNHNGVKDAFWSLRTQEYKDYCLILADVAASVLHIFESKYPEDKRPRNAIEAIRLWHAGEIADEELKVAAYAAYAASYFAYSSAYVAAYAADAASYFAYSSAYSSAYDAARSAADAAAAYVYAAYAASVYAAAAAYAQWKKNEEILRKYLED